MTFHVVKEMEEVLALAFSPAELPREVAAAVG
jgi:hypothetical protein